MFLHIHMYTYVQAGTTTVLFCFKTIMDFCFKLFELYIEELNYELTLYIGSLTTFFLF